ncbi:peptidase S8 [Micromonospora arborensis]|uniref:Peptidase S8 n=1 Tax=Micromonospora arborensis TaxID=2116518 RepID=A0A318NF28_9ACTN|nr:S8 family serine peptidase [Micromonospora arborensis]PYC64322.1 peptidase S8 [Micromonospora arborensis]
MGKRVRGIWAAALSVALAVAGVGQAGAAESDGTAVSGSTRVDAADSLRTVTLVSGDRVRVRSGTYEVQPGPGRERMVFAQHRIGGHDYVIPADALSMIGARRVDRRLFDITELLASRYDDAEQTELPLLVRATDQTAARQRASGYAVARDLPGIRAQAVRVPKKRAGEFWRSLDAQVAGKTASAGVERVWLDGQRQISLDHSVPQIGAPAVWQAGRTGRGVTVAVLDTGIDATHPDFTGRLAQVRNFTDDPDADDHVGHGTHVASIIAGSGAASGGRYRGVAPDATLLVGKVCTDGGCPDSAILAGMEWAAANGAVVVNLSLGGADTTELDPLKEAVETLTARTGTLFVVAAGNSGPQARSISSPASADSALAVGAMDGADKLAESSSRGPRLAGGAIKPEITAPGVDIVAARARNSEADDPVDESYTRMSGTSMATPHVAGSAALLAQQHPTFRAADLKATLMGTAKPDATSRLTEQGAGRVDVAAASGSTLRADPPAVDLGIAKWPHQDDRAASRTVAFRNDGATAATLSLTVSVTGPDGTHATDGMFRIEPAQLTVAAGGSASATITARTAISGSEGVYEGRVVASGPAGVVRIPVTIDREPESYDLKLTHLDRTGSLTDSYNTFLDGLSASGTVVPYEPDGTASIRLRAGSYHLTSVISDEHGDDRLVSLLTQPQLELTADTTVVLDARLAKSSTVTVPRPAATPTGSVIGYYRHLPDGSLNAASVFSFGGMTPLFAAQFGPALPGNEMRGRLQTVFTEPGPDGQFGSGSHRYHLAWFPSGQVPSGIRQEVRTADLAQVEATYPASESGTIGEKTVFASRPDYTESVSFGGTVPLPATRTEYYSRADDIRWSADVRMGEVQQMSAPTAYPAGRQTESWQAGPLSPGFPAPPSSITVFSDGYWVTRQGNRIFAAVPLFSDRDIRHAGVADTTSYTQRLLRDGQPVPLIDDYDYEVPAAAANYRYSVTATRDTELSTRVQAEWTFRSEKSEKLARLPVMAVRFAPALDGDNAAPAGRDLRIPVTVQRQAGATPAQVRSLTVEVSFDDGQTWRLASVQKSGAGWLADVHHPAGAGYAALRAYAVDQSGNTVRQTIIRAYRIKG